MQYTSAEANKLLKRLQEEKARMEAEDAQRSTFVAATVENPLDVKPEYVFIEMDDVLRELDRKIRVVKHAINVFNTTQIVGGFDITIDEMLVLIPQLTARKRVLRTMSDRLPKARKQQRYGEKSNFIEYEYANYNVSEVTQMYNAVSETLTKAQIALDKTNNSATMEITI